MNFTFGITKKGKKGTTTSEQFPETPVLTVYPNVEGSKRRFRLNPKAYELAGFNSEGGDQYGDFSYNLVDSNQLIFANLTSLGSGIKISKNGNFSNKAAQAEIIEKFFNGNLAEEASFELSPYTGEMGIPEGVTVFSCILLREVQEELNVVDTTNPEDGFQIIGTIDISREEETSSPQDGNGVQEVDVASTF